MTDNANIENKIENKKTKKKLLTAVLILIVLAIVSFVGTAIYFNFFDDSQPVDSDGVIGRIIKDWDTGAEDSSAAQSGGIQIPGYSTAEMKEGDTYLHLSVGNPKSNECGFYATLKLEDGTELYKSQLLNPGEGLMDIPLSETLKKGEYKAMVYYQCVTLDEEHKPLNSAESEFTLIVK